MEAGIPKSIGASALQPPEIGSVGIIILRRHIIIIGISHGKRISLGQNGGISPFVDFSMAVRKGNSTGAVMVAGGIINPSGMILGRRIANKRTIVNTVRVLIHENPGMRSAQNPQVRLFDEPIHIGVLRIPIVEVIDPGVHRHASNLWIHQALEAGETGIIGRAKINSGIVNIRIDQAQFDPFPANVGPFLPCIAEVGGQILSSWTPLSIGRRS